MKKLSIIFSLIYLILICTFSSILAENEKRAQTGLKFLEVSLDARASAMGGALTALEASSTSLFYNPAGMTRMNDFFHISLGQLNYIADFKYLYGTAAINFEQGRYGILGFSFVSVDYGDFIGTIRADNDQGFLETGIFKPSAYAIGVGYARALSERFSVGGNVKYVYQNLTGGYENFAEDQSTISRAFETDVIAYDFGILYKTGFESLNFGMNLRNFSKELKYIEESFQLPLTFEIGLSINAIDFTDLDHTQHSLLISIDAVHPRDFSEQIDFGLEYVFMNTFALRTGMSSPSDEEGMSFGAGFFQNISDVNFNFDYTYTSFGVFDDVHRFTVQFGY